MARRAPSSMAPTSMRVARTALLALDEFAHAGFENAFQRAALVAAARLEAASWYSVCRLPPDQKLRSNSSVGVARARIANILRKM